MEIQNIIAEQYIAKRQKEVEPRYRLSFDHKNRSSHFAQSSLLLKQQKPIIKKTGNKKNKDFYAFKQNVAYNSNAITKFSTVIAKATHKNSFLNIFLYQARSFSKQRLTALVSLTGAKILGAVIFFAFLFSLITISISYSKKVDLSGFFLPADMMISSIMLDKLSPLPQEPEETGFSSAKPLTIPKTINISNYTIKKNDTLDAIAKRHGLRLDTLISINNIADARKINIGKTLKIPSQDGLFHIVKKGESLTKIALANSISLMDIIDANDLDTQTIVPGQSLFIPGARLSSYDLKKAMGNLVIWPVNGPLSSNFGYRSNPFTGVRSFHNGIDIVGPLNMQVKAAIDGKVAETGFSTVFGNYVILTHPENYQTLYAHLNAIKVKQGQSISQGSTVGLLGSTGYSTGPHVHFSVFKNGNAMDPLKLLK